MGKVLLGPLVGRWGFASLIYLVRFHKLCSFFGLLETARASSRTLSLSTPATKTGCLLFSLRWKMLGRLKRRRVSKCISEDSSHAQTTLQSMRREFAPECTQALDPLVMLVPQAFSGINSCL